ncbi:lytic murein transglycosylase B [Montanilutibacter psychrotolerans]|uniref:Lytic murein transglycosylase B n=1 Tax=Montanilutibacter psychrotolerans TaxID=1327343 RepID=A0A3M8SN77_9GAMM|nr:lytic murein transglycosylase B [Lysobacter psychrotolerans]RNF82828.1 lytic murein transglycosylase B [Lysobacter psychrotolerans]
MSRSHLARRASICALSLALAACATQAPTPLPSVQAPAAAVPVTPAPGTPALPEPHVPMPIEQARPIFIRDTAARYGIDPAHIASVLARAEIRDSIVAAMSRPAEAKPWRDYRPIFIAQPRIDGGRAFLAQHRAALSRVEAQTGVPAEIIVAIIGVETSYGRNTGSYPVIDALYTLAFAYPRSGDPAKADRENRREAFFRGELAQLFALGKETGMDITTLTGSYAGAMGWGQFMPSSYREFAVDGNGDGRRDLFNSTDDVFASIANYFVKKGGWVRGGPVTVRALRAAGSSDFEPEALDPVYSLPDLAARGYRPATPVPGDETAVPLNLDGAAGREYWLGFRNFYAITRYNISKHYAMAVYQLSQAIAGRDVALDGVADGQPGA